MASLCRPAALPGRPRIARLGHSARRRLAAASCHRLLRARHDPRRSDHRAARCPRLTVAPTFRADCAYSSNSQVSGDQARVRRRLLSSRSSSLAPRFHCSFQATTSSRFARASDRLAEQRSRRCPASGLVPGFVGGPVPPGWPVRLAGDAPGRFYSLIVISAGRRGLSRSRAALGFSDSGGCPYETWGPGRQVARGAAPRARREAGGVWLESGGERARAHCSAMRRDSRRAGCPHPQRERAGAADCRI
jgi:hypothetical protein